jgi:tetratricopeptide (TPR) repeat protein
MDSTFSITHARLQDWYEIQGDFENAREIRVAVTPEFIKIKEHPSREEYWRGVIEVAKVLSESKGESYTDRIIQANAWTQLGDYEKALTWLEKSAAKDDDLLPNMIRSPILDPLHGNPRYVAVLSKLNLAP